VALAICFALGQLRAAEERTTIASKQTSLTNPSVVPNLIGSDGRYTSEARSFTTEAYEQEAFKLVLQEANKVAQELNLDEKLPITRAEVTSAFILGYGMSQIHNRAIGNIHTKNYGYFVSRDYKLSDVGGAHQDRDAVKWKEEYTWPKSRMDTNAAYRLATQWLASSSMDVEGLNRECELHIEPDRYWNAGMRKKKTFVPMYEVYWLSPRNKAEHYGDVALVVLFAPTKTLIDLSVRESKYILRRPLEFTNLNELLSQPKKR